MMLPNTLNLLNGFSFEGQELQVYSLLPATGSVKATVVVPPLVGVAFSKFPTKYMSLLTQNGYEVISFKYVDNQSDDVVFDNITLAKHLNKVLNYLVDKDDRVLFLLAYSYNAIPSLSILEAYHGYLQGIVFLNPMLTPTDPFNNYETFIFRNFRQILPQRFQNQYLVKRLQSMLPDLKIDSHRFGKHEFKSEVSNSLFTVFEKFQHVDSIDKQILIPCTLIFSEEDELLQFWKKNRNRRLVDVFESTFPYLNVHTLKADHFFNHKLDELSEIVLNYFDDLSQFASKIRGLQA